MRRIVASVTVGAVLTFVPIVGAIPAFAAASPQASCNGIGGSTETALGGPGARADISHEFKNDAAGAGTTPGGIYKVFAQEHLGSIDACFG